MLALPRRHMYTHTYICTQCADSKVKIHLRSQSHARSFICVRTSQQCTNCGIIYALIAYCWSMNINAIFIRSCVPKPANLMSSMYSLHTCHYIGIPWHALCVYMCAGARAQKQGAIDHARTHTRLYMSKSFLARAHDVSMCMFVCVCVCVWNCPMHPNAASSNTSAYGQRARAGARARVCMCVCVCVCVFTSALYVLMPPPAPPSHYTVLPPCHLVTALVTAVVTTLVTTVATALVTVQKPSQTPHCPLGPQTLQLCVAQ